VNLNIICQNTNKAHNLKFRLQQLLFKVSSLATFLDVMNYCTENKPINTQLFSFFEGWIGRGA
jgi:hypothetical protein